MSDSLRQSLEEVSFYRIRAARNPCDQVLGNLTVYLATPDKNGKSVIGEIVEEMEDKSHK